MPETREMCHDSTRFRWKMVNMAGPSRDATKWEQHEHGGLSVSQGRQWRDTSKRRRTEMSAFVWWSTLLCLLCSLAAPATAALLEFENCLSKTILESSPLTLQFVPLDVGVWFNPSNSLNPLNVTVYGNVSGTADQTTNYPPENSANWTNPNATEGKIIDLDTSTSIWTTLFTTFNVLSFTPYYHPSRFCNSVVQGECPLAPVFHYNL